MDFLFYKISNSGTRKWLINNDIKLEGIGTPKKLSFQGYLLLQQLAKASNNCDSIVVSNIVKKPISSKRTVTIDKL